MGNLISPILFQPPNEPPMYMHSRYRRTYGDVIQRQKSCLVDIGEGNLAYWIIPKKYFKSINGTNFNTSLKDELNLLPVLLFSHANAEDIHSTFEWVVQFADALNVRILLYEYPGYSTWYSAYITKHHHHSNDYHGLGSMQVNDLQYDPVSCTPSEERCCTAIEKAYEYLITVHSVPPRSIIIYGRSLGSGPSVHLAAKLGELGVAVGGLIIQVNANVLRM